MIALTFSIPGKIVSGNRASRIVDGRAVKSAEKRRDEERIRSLAFAAAQQAGWKPPARAAVYIVAFCSLLDADNLCKALLDSLKPIAIVDDRPKHLSELHVRHVKDEHGERYYVRIEPR